MTFVSKFILFVLCVLAVCASPAYAADQTTPSTPATSTTTIPAVTQPSTKKLWEISLWTALGERSFSNESAERSLQVAGALEPRLKYTLNENFLLYLRPQLTVASSQILQRFGDFNYGNRVSLVEGYAQWSPVSFLDVRGGAINQKYLQSPFLSKGYLSFPGLQEIGFWQIGKDSEIKVTAQQTVPTSDETSAIAVVDREDVPTFFTETLSLRTKAVRPVDLEVFGTFYAFQNLSSQTAFDSSLWGNLTNDYSLPSSARFRYDFMGWVGGVNSEARVAKALSVKAGVNMIENLLAADGANQGQLVYFGPEIDFSEKFSIEPRAEIFFNESDTAPSAYNSSDYGHNNRQGMGGQIKLNFRKPDFAITAKYVQADVINDANSNQTKQQFFELKLETTYDIL